MRLTFSPAAVEDLQSISNYTLEFWGEAQEARYLHGLLALLDDISADPTRFRLRNDLLQNCRSVRHEKHIVFFIAENDAVLIIRILHSAMDFLSHLREDPS